MNLSKQELIYIRNSLLSSRMYKGAKLPHNAVIWEEWMHDFLKKINNQLDKQKMHYDFQGQAIQFRVQMDQPIGAKADLILQRQLISEEYWEFNQAVADYKPDKFALKELADLVFVCFQYATAAGWELDEALDRVFKSNLSKLENGKPVKNAAGKVMKGRNYKPPYLDDIV